MRIRICRGSRFNADDCEEEARQEASGCEETVYGPQGCCQEAGPQDQEESRKAEDRKAEDRKAENRKAENRKEESNKEEGHKAQGEEKIVPAQEGRSGSAAGDVVFAW
jgi:hypothetical protein